MKPINHSSLGFYPKWRIKEQFPHQNDVIFRLTKLDQSPTDFFNRMATGNKFKFQINRLTQDGKYETVRD